MATVPSLFLNNCDKKHIMTKVQSGEIQLEHADLPDLHETTEKTTETTAKDKQATEHQVSAQFADLGSFSAIQRAASDVGPRRAPLEIGESSNSAHVGSAPARSASAMLLGRHPQRSDSQITTLSRHSSIHPRAVGVPEAPAGEATPGASGLISAMQAFTRVADIRTLLSRADDSEFLAPLQGSDGELARLSANVADLKALLGGDDIAVPAEMKTAITARLDHVSQALGELATNKPLTERAAKIVTIHALLAPLPLLVPMFSKPAQQKAEAEIIALIFKAMVEGIGMMRTPTAGNLLLKDRTMSRYYANLVQAVLFALPTFVKSMQKLNSNLPFNAALGVLSTGALFGGFMSKEIKEKYNTWRSGDAHPAMAQAGQEMFSGASPLSEEQQQRVRNVLNQIVDTIGTDQKSLLDTKETFVADGHHEISPHVSKQVSIAVDTYQRLADEMASLLGTHAPELATENRDRNAKLALAVFATAVCVATTALMVPDKIGVVDLGSDAAFTSALMFSMVANANVNRRDALEEFKTFVGLSIVMLAVLAANKGAKDYMEKGVSGLLVGSIAMTGLNLILPGPIGHSAASGLEKLINLKPSDLVSALRGIGNKVYQMFGGAAEEVPPCPSSVVIEELDEHSDLESGLPA